MKSQSEGALVGTSPASGMSLILQPIGKAIDGLSFTAATIGGLLIMATAVFTNYEIFSRYIFNKPTKWTLEVSVFILIWFGFISLAYVQQSRKHISVDLLLHAMKERTRLAWDILGLLFSLLFAVIFTYFAYDFFSEAWLTNEESPDMLSAPMWIPKLALLFGPGLLILQLLKDLCSDGWRFLSYRKAPWLGFDLKNFLPIPIFLTALAVAWALLKFSPLAGLVCLLLLLLFGGIPIYAGMGSVTSGKAGGLNSGTAQSD